MSLSNQEMEKILMESLRLYHHPVAITFLFSDEEVEEFKKTVPYVEGIKPLTFCQWELAARMQNKVALGTAEGLGCSNAHVSFGWKEIDDNEIKSHSKYCADLDQAGKFVRSKSALGLGEIKAMAVGPLAMATRTPDVVHFYCDNMQSYHLAVDYMAATGQHPLRPAITMNSSACGGTVFCYQEQTFNCCPACSGSYNAGKTERGEVNVFIPGNHIEMTVKRLLDRIEKGGSSSITRPGDSFPGADICKNCPLIVFKKGTGSACEGCTKK